MDTIRNFVIIAHIDHGKSTLADRLLELTHTVEARRMKPQLLDQMELERERGITIKMQPVRMIYHPHGTIDNSQLTNNRLRQMLNIKSQLSSDSGFILNLIDTPGHIDFSYEVSRALAAVEGAILLVDATQGVQAQTLTNLYIAREQGLTIIPVVNKIDLPEARVKEVAEELTKLINMPADEILYVSAKTGAGVPELLEAIVRKVPAPRRGGSQLRALIFDSQYENHKGVIAHVRLFDGEIKKGERAQLVALDASFEVKEVGVFSPALSPKEKLSPGEIGYIVTGLKTPDVVRIGDTIIGKIKDTRHLSDRQAGEIQALPGYREPKPVIWANMFPENQDEFDALADALGKLKLNDASLTFEVDASPALGRSFRCGFLGMLHLEIVAERLRREFYVPVITTSPSVAYTVALKDGREEVIASPAKFPSRDALREVREPWFSVEIITPAEHLGSIVKLIEVYEGVMGGAESFGQRGGNRLRVSCELPLREAVSGFFDELKSVSAGYASLSYEEAEARPADVERMDILVAGEKIPALSKIVSRKKLHHMARSTVEKIKEVLPRQLFAVKIQAEAGGRVIAAETLSALKKDVTGYLYGGDRTRKMKLWKKQKRGKERLAAAGRVTIPPEVYLKVLR